MQMTDLSLAIVHDYLIKQGGSENVVESLLRLYPNSPLYTSLYSPETLPEWWRSFSIQTSFLQPWAEWLGILADHYQDRLKVLFPFMPLAYENFDLTAYDCVISSSHAFAKGILTGSQTLHIAYIHSPPRYLWELTGTYLERGRIQGWQKPLTQWLLHRLRQWDFLAAQRPDILIANSHYIRRRIQKFYRREATVIYPPVRVNLFQPVADPATDYDLVASRLVPYKRVDLALKAYNQMGRRLLVVGEGPELPRLKEMAGSTIEFLPHQSLEQLQSLFAHCRYLIFPWAEDFGIIPVEVQACGRPVIALGVGGVAETVISGKTGILFMNPTPASLIEAVQQADQCFWDPTVIRKHAEQFSEDRFHREIRELVQGSWENFQKSIGSVSEKG
jgi:glycosyltransferase involved in cell wall biosynthesis